MVGIRKAVAVGGGVLWRTFMTRVIKELVFLDGGRLRAGKVTTEKEREV